MAILDLDTLLNPVSEEAPCGPNLEYDADYVAFEQAARGKPEQQYGSTIIPSEEPDWSEVRRLGLDLVRRSKDLRVSCQLVRGLLETDGFPAFAEALMLARGYLERYWPTLHPQLDPEDNNDPTLRVNTVVALNDSATTIRSLRTAPMVTSRLLGRFSLRDFGVANGEIPPALNEEAPKRSSIEAAFMECDLEQLRNDTAAIRASLEHAEAIEATLTGHVGTARAVSLENLRNTLGEMHTVLAEHLSRRDASQDQSGGSGEAGDSAGGNSVSAGRQSGDIRSREDVVHTLEKICQYYARNEPSSPLPLLLNRAKRLASKSFLEIVQDLTPDAVAQIQALGGVEGNKAEE